MAYEDSNAGLPAPAHPMANPGYGKRSVPDQDPESGPRRPADFSQLPDRAAYIAALIDALPEGAAMDVKTLANTNDRYGQMAVGGALNELSRAGHLRRVRALTRSADGGFRHVTHTLWSRTAHDDEWWTRHLDADTTDTPEQEPPGPRAAAQPEEPVGLAQEAHRADGYRLLAELAQVSSQLTLSAADCAQLQDLAAEWLARGATPDHLTRALSADLPADVRVARGFVRHRLLDKMPPEPLSAPKPTARREARAIMECTDCGVPGRPEALPEGLCLGCRSAPPTAEAHDVPRTDVRTHVAGLRAALAAAS